MTTRRIDKTRKPRRPAARPAARPVDSTRSGGVPSGETAPEPTPVIEAAAAAPEPIESAEIRSAGTEAAEIETTEIETAHNADIESERAIEQATTEEPADAPLAVAQEPVVQEPVAQESVAEGSVAEEASFGTSAPEAGDAFPSPQAPGDEVTAGSEPSPLENTAEDQVDPEPVAGPAGTEPIAEVEETPAVAAVDAPAPAAEAGSETPERPAAADAQEIPLAAMQGFIEINGRLVAFMQGESQAAVAFWLAALAVRSPGDLAQLQAAEMNRAIDAAIACWTDLARRMGRFASYAPRARAA